MPKCVYFLSSVPKARLYRSLIRVADYYRLHQCYCLILHSSIRGTMYYR